MNKFLTASFLALVPAAGLAEEASNYDGFFAGALASYGSADATVLQRYYQPGGYAAPMKGVQPRSFPLNLSADGWQGGVVLGYNWDVGEPQGWVLGAEVDYFGGSLSFDGTSRYRHVLDIGARSLSVGNQVTARLRAGYDFNGLMPYVAAGGSCASVEVHAVQWMVRPHHESGTACGFSGALGAEYRFEDGPSLRLEHRVTDYGSVEVEQTIFGVVMHF